MKRSQLIETAIFLILILIWLTLLFIIDWSTKLKVIISIIIMFLYFVVIFADIIVSWEKIKKRREIEKALRLAPKKTLKLSDTYRHLDSLIWQVPSWSIAISAGVIVAANQLSNCDNKWIFPVKYIRGAILLFGTFLLSALSVAIFKYRASQAASVDGPAPHPPFGVRPKANPFLQGAICLTSGGLFGLALAQFFSLAWLIIHGFLIGALAWIYFEIRSQSVVEEIKVTYTPRAKRTRKS